MIRLLLIPIAILFAVLLRLGIGVLNHSRIRNYVEAQGGRVLDIKWDPFGAGWFGEKDSVIYLVRYRDREENVHQAQCKTGIFTGVYFSNDNIINRKRRPETGEQHEARNASAPEHGETQNLLAELRRLKEENVALRREIDRLQTNRAASERA